MKLKAFKDLLQTHRDKPFHLILPNRSAIPVSFHITEVAYAQKRFIDCGGRRHTIQTCQLQAWIGPDADHRLRAEKMVAILDLAKDILPDAEDLDIEIEYEDAVISQYPIADYEITESAVTLNLALKHTDCLAKESCLPLLPMTQGAAGCCGPDCCAPKGEA